MKRMRKALCLFLSLLLCLSSFPVSVLAADGEESAEELVAESPEIEEAPVEEAPPEETPVEEIPVEEAPAEEAPVEEAPVEEAPAEELAEEVETVEVTFVCPEADLALLAVFAAGDREHPVEAKEPGVYELLPGEYVYTYPGVDETAFTVGAEALTVSFALPMVVEESPAEETAEPEEAPVEEAPIEEAPVEEEPVEEEPVEETPAEEESVEDEEAPTEEPLPAMVSLTSPGVSSVVSGSCGTGLSWSLSEEGELTISGSGAMTNYSNYGSDCPWVSYADQISSLVVSEGVTSVGKYAFAGLTKLASVSLPESVTSIGSYAFYGCSALTGIGVPDGVLSLSPFTFGMCTSLQSVTLPSTMNAIGEGAFLRCEALTGIELPRDLNVIADDAFSNCYGMTGTFTIPVSVYEIGNNVFGGTPLKAFAVESGNFYFSTDEYGILFNYNKSELIKAPEGWIMYNTYVVPYSVTSIRPYALSYLSQLSGLMLPPSLTIIPEGMLMGSKMITGLVIPNGVTSIGANAFAGVYTLRQLSIPSSVEVIDASAFIVCDNLETISVDSDNLYYTNDGYGAVLTADLTSLVCVPRAYTGVYVVPDSVQRIEDYALYGCRLCQVTFPASLNYLGQWSVSCCHNLHFVALPTGITEVPVGAFSNCTALEAIYLRQNVIDISNNAFDYCTNLKRLYYAGSDEQFNQIVVNGGNDPLNDLSRWMNVFDAGYCGAALDWMLTADGGLNIYGHGAMFNYASNTPWADYLEPQMTCNFPGISFVQVFDGVTTVGDYAFCHARALEQLVLADTVTEVCDYAFASCTSLNDIVWSAGLKTIGDYAFRGISQQIIRLPDGVETLGEGAFTDSLAEQIFLPDSVTVIGDSAFFSNTNLNYIRLSENVKVLDGTMFGYDTSLESINIPASVEYIYERAFQGCTKLTEILVNEDSRTYKTINGCVYTKDGTKLVIVPEGITGWLDIPYGVTEIGPYACQYGRITGVTFPDSLTTIYHDAFWHCLNIFSLDIPGSVTGIGLYAFPVDPYFEPKLADIFFYGTEAMWDQIDLDPDGLGSTFTREEKLQKLLGNVRLHFVPSLDKPVLTLQNTASGVKCSWNTVENAEDYFVYRDGGDGYVTAGNAARNEFTDAGAENGRSYSYFVRAIASGFLSKDSDPVAITCVKTLAAPDFTLTNTSSGVKLAWSAVANAEGYQVSRKGPGESSYTILDTITGRSYTDTTAVDGSAYYYRVRAVNGSVLSGYTTQKIICAKSFAKPVFTLTNTSSGVKLAWTAVANAAGYRISRKGPGESSYKLLDTVTTKSYTDKTAEDGKAYSYRVRAESGSVLSGYNTLTITCVTTLEKPVPNAPSNTSSGVKLTWSAVANAEGYRISRKGPGETSYSVLDIVTGKTYTDKTAEDGVTYSYIVRAVNGSVLSSYTAKSILCVKTLSKPAPTLTNTANGVKLTWSAVANAEGYRISRKGPGENGYTDINTVTGRSYTDKTAEDGVTYSYRVRAVNGSVISSYTTKTVTCVKSLAKPAPTLTLTSTGVKLSWSAVPNAKEYRITRKGPGESSYTLLDTVTGRTFTDKTAEKGKTYSYIVRAVNGSVMSGYTAKSITVK